MYLTEISKEEFSDEEIQKIVYDGIDDDNSNTYYGIVFGNSNILEDRMKCACKALSDGRVEKLILTGGVNGVSNQSGSIISEAKRMYDYALKSGVDPNKLIMEEESSNTFLNVSNSLAKLPGSVNKVAIITSEFHLKRCYAIIKKVRPSMEVVLIHAKDGFTDEDNWYLSDNSWNSGRSLTTYEAALLVKYAKEGKIADLKVDI